MTGRTTSPKNLIALDLLRFAAAFFVLTSHYFADFLLPQSGAVVIGHQIGDLARPAPFTSIASYGWLGVEIFFVMSGYVIAMSAMASSAKTFAAKRFWRLWPTAFLCATITFLAIIASGFWSDTLWLEWLRSATLYPLGRQIDGVYWTLGVEIVFYTLAGLTIVISQRKDRILWLGTLIGGISLASHILIPSIAFSGTRITILLNLPFGAFFALGIALYHAHNRISLRLAIWSIPIWLATCIYVVGLRALDRFSNLPFAITQGEAIIIFLSGALVVACAPFIQPFLARWLSVRLTALMGLMTYPLYLLHQTVGAIVIGALMRAGLSYYAATLITIFCMLSLSWAIVAIAEPKMRQLCKVVFRKSGVNASPPSPARRLSSSLR